MKVPTIDSTTCNAQDWYSGIITPRMLCAGYEEGLKDTCAVISDQSHVWSF